MNRQIVLTGRALITVVPLIAVLVALYLTGAFPSPVMYIAAVTAIGTSVLIEPFRSTIARAAFVEQQQAQVCGQALVALQAAKEWVQEVMVEYHPNYSPRISKPRAQHGNDVLNKLSPIIGLTQMWLPAGAKPLESLTEEIRDSIEYGTPKVQEYADAYPDLRKALRDAEDAIILIRRDLP